MKGKRVLMQAITAQIPFDIVQRIDRLCAVVPGRLRLTRSMLIRRAITALVEALEKKYAAELAAYDEKKSTEEEDFEEEEILLEAFG